MVQERLAGCSKWPDVSPTQPRRAKTRLFPNAAVASYHLLRGGWDDPNCARPTRAFGGRALREHRDRPSYPVPFFSILLEVGFSVVSLTPATLDTSHWLAPMLPGSQTMH
jgi:hypothetical protein